MPLAMVWITAFLAGCAAERPLQRAEFTRLCMGVQTRIVLFAPSQNAAFSAAAAAFDRINQLDTIMSDYQTRSELNRVSDGAGGPAIPISSDLFTVLATANQVSVETEGAFDATIGPAVRLWRTARSSGRLPSDSELAHARSLVNYRNLILDAPTQTARLTTPGMRLDLGGIGKGYAAQEAVELLTSRGTPRCLVALAGDIVAGDPPPGASGWTVSINGEQGPEERPATLSLARAAVSTSGDTAQFVEIDGRRYSHICDPRTGLGIQARRSVTVVAPRGELSDALATAACILGLRDTLPILAGSPDTAAVFQLLRGDAVITDTFDPHHILHWSAPPPPTPPIPVVTAPSPRIPTVDLAAESERQIVVDQQPDQYLGHVSTVLLEDGRTVLAVYPKGHGAGSIILKRSSDGGLTWSQRQPVPDNWATSKECPTIHRIIDPATGQRRLILFSGLFPCRQSTSEDDGRTWTPLAPVQTTDGIQFGGIVTMGCVERLADGRYLALFHDDGRFFNPANGTAGKSTGTFTLYQIISSDGGRTWTPPRAIWSGSDIHLCEPGIVRSPDGKQLAILLRENRRVKNSHIMFSDDEAEAWTPPHPLPPSLTGDRHTPKYLRDGRLFISFRDTDAQSPTKGDWVAWIGTYADLTRGTPGQFRLRLMDNTHEWDCAYPGLEILPSGVIVATTYGHWFDGQPPYIVSVRIAPQELDAFAAAATHAR